MILKWLAALAAVVGMWHVAYHEGERDGSRGLGYWSGWQDAMTATDYGRKEYDPEKTL